MSSLRSPAFGRRRAAGLVALAIGACACAVSAGEHGGRGGRAMMRAPSFAAARPAKPPGGPRPAPAREQGPPPVPVERPVDRPPDTATDRPGKPGKLTPDERRALRQQINDAGRDIYRAPRP